VLILTVVSVYSENTKAEFFRRYAHYATICGKGIFANPSVNYDAHGKNYIKTGDVRYLSEIMQKLGISSIEQLERMFESASSYTTVERELLNAKVKSIGLERYNKGEEMLYALLALNKPEIQPQRYGGTHNHPVSFTGYYNDVLNQDASKLSLSGYIQYLKNNCKTFVASIRWAGNPDSKETVDIKFNIEEFMQFPIPIF
jgi:hypothetical protein